MLKGYEPRAKIKIMSFEDFFKSGFMSDIWKDFALSRLDLKDYYNEIDNEKEHSYNCGRFYTFFDIPNRRFFVQRIGCINPKYENEFIIIKR